MQPTDDNLRTAILAALLLIIPLLAGVLKIWLTLAHTKLTNQLSAVQKELEANTRETIIIKNEIVEQNATTKTTEE